MDKHSDDDSGDENLNWNRVRDVTAGNIKRGNRNSIARRSTEYKINV